MKKVLILGGIGFIGSSLVDILLEDYSYDVTVFSQSPINIDNIERCRYITIEYTQENFLKHFSCNNYDVIHVLSGNPYPSYSLNNPWVDVELTIKPVLALLECLKTISYSGSIWVASSVAVYGSCKDEFLNERSECSPISNYGVAKIAVETYVKHYASTYNLSGGIYRIFSTYGPGLKRQVIYENIMRMSKKTSAPIHEIKLLSSFDSARDFSYVEDQALGIKFLSENIVPYGDIFNLGSGQSHKIIDVVNTIARLMNYECNIIAQKNIRTFDGMSWTADISKIESLGFTQKYKLEDGIRRTIESIFK